MDSKRRSKWVDKCKNDIVHWYCCLMVTGYNEPWVSIGQLRFCNKCTPLLKGVINLRVEYVIHKYLMFKIPYRWYLCLFCTPCNTNSIRYWWTPMGVGERTIVIIWETFIFYWLWCSNEKFSFSSFVHIIIPIATNGLLRHWYRRRLVYSSRLQ